jgi:hypothetical protein
MSKAPDALLPITLDSLTPWLLPILHEPRLICHLVIQDHCFMTGFMGQPFEGGSAHVCSLAVTRYRGETDRFWWCRDVDLMKK